jgi:hypothetical protein
MSAPNAHSHASLNARITGLEQAVLAIKEGNEAAQKATEKALGEITDHIGKLYDRVGQAKIGPTWGGIGQVAGVLASYSVLIAFVVGIYVRSEILANEVAIQREQIPSIIIEAEQRGAFEARVKAMEVAAK